MEKIIRIFDLNKPEADPFCLGGSESGIRCALFGRNDNILLTSCVDHSGVRYESTFILDIIKWSFCCFFSNNFVRVPLKLKVLRFPFVVIISYYFCYFFWSHIIAQIMGSA